MKIFTKFSNSTTVSAVKKSKTNLPNKNWLILMLLILGMFEINLGYSQTNPAAQTLPYSQNFGTTTFTAMPTGMAAWNGVPGSTSTQAAAEASAPTGNATVTAATATSTTGATFGYMVSTNARPYIQTSGNATNGANQIALALNTTGFTAVTINYDVEIISAQPRTIGIVMQYRVGSSGAWTTVTGTGNPYSQTAGTTGLKATPSIVLPVGASNQAVVQIRWAVWRGTQTGNSSGIAIDNISVTGTSAACSTPDVATGLSATNGSSQSVISWTNGTCNDEVVIFAKSGSFGTDTPTGDGSVYTANLTFGSGTAFDGGTCVYKGGSSPQTILGLTNGTTYTFKIFTRKGSTWTSGAASPTTTATPALAEYFWDANGAAALTGGTGTWDNATTSNWRTPNATGTLGLWSGNTVPLDAIFAGTAGTVTAFAGSTFTAPNFRFNTTNYVLTASSTTTTNFNGVTNLASNVVLNLGDINAATGIRLGFGGNITGGANSSINFNLNGLITNNVRLDLVAPNATLSVPMTATAGLNAVTYGNMSVSSNTTGAVLTSAATIDNTTLYPTAIGATSGNALTVNSVISGSAPLMFGAGSSGGAGTVILNAANTYTGETRFNAAVGCFIRNGINNALPPTTNVIHPYSTSNGGIWDLNSFNQTIASLTSLLGGGSITNNNAGTGTSTLTINGSSSPAAFTLPITNGATAFVALTRAGSGTTILSGINTYTGATNVTGGRLLVNAVNTGASPVTVGASGTFGGSGTSPGTLSVSGTVNPGGTATGNTIATLNTGAITLAPSGTMIVEVNNFLPISADRVTSSGIVDITATSGTPFNIDLTGFTAANVLGVVPNFNNGTNYSITILSGSSINGFAVNKFNLITSNFTSNNPLAGGTWTIEQSGSNINLVYTLGSVSPLLTITGSLSSFSGSVNSGSVYQTYNISGSDLTGFPSDILVSAPSKYEVSLLPGSDYGASVNVNFTSATLASTPIYVRIANGQTAGAANGTISHVGGGASVNQSVTGNISLFEPGDIQITGINTATPDGFAWVTWVEIPANTEIKFTDGGFLSAASANATNNFRGGESYVTWSSTTSTPPGTVIRMVNTSGSTTTVTGGGTATGALSGLSGSGDQIFVFTGADPTAPSSNPTTFNGSVIFGLTIGVAGTGGGVWITTGTASSNNSYLPSELTVSNANFAIESATQNGQYTSSRNNQLTYNAYKPNVANTSNWTFNAANITLNETDFVLSSGLPQVSVSSNLSAGTEAGTTAITITATVTGTIASSQTVNVAVTGTNITGGDYTLTNTVITIAAGTNTTGTVTFTVTNDVLFEGAETATLTISSPSAGIELGINTTVNIAITDNDVPALVINEIMYNNAGADEEWLEIYNAGSTAVTLDNNWSIANTSPSWDRPFTASHVIPAGGYATVRLGSSGAFPFTPNLSLSTGANQLVNSNSMITLKYTTLTIDQVTYSDAAPLADADDNGPSLSLNNAALDNSTMTNWGACKGGGTPGAANVACNATTYYSVSTGSIGTAGYTATNEIWSTSPTGTVGVKPTIDENVSLVIKNTHIVTNHNTGQDVKDLTINAGGTLLANTDAATPHYFDVFGNVSNSGTIGKSIAPYNDISFDFEGINCSFTGNGTSNVARIRKDDSNNTTTNLTLNSNITLRYAGTCLYNDQAGTNFNVTIAAGKTITASGSTGSNGDVSIDGVAGTDITEKGGTFTVNGTLRVTGKLYAISDNITNASAFTIGATGVITTKDADVRVLGINNMMTITAGGRLNVTGIIKNLDGTFNSNGGLTLNSGATLLHGTGTPGITGGSVTGNITVKRNGTTGFGSYNYWSAPVLNPTMNSIMAAGNNPQNKSYDHTYEYTPDDATGSDVAGLRAGWANKTFGDLMSPAKGYITVASSTATFTGVANEGTLNRGVSGNAFTRFNLIGNPYPSAIDAAAFLAANSANIEPVLYFWDDDATLFGSGYSAADYATGNAVGIISPSATNNTSYNLNIASCQGFFVDAKPAATAVQFTNAMRSTTNSAFFDAPAEISRMWVSVKNQVGLYNETLLAFIPTASDDRDEIYDAKKLFGNANLSLYTTLGEDAFGIQAWGELTQDRIIPLGLNSNLIGNHTISIQKMESIDPTVLVFLEDVETGAFHNLRKGDYEFNLTGETNGANRFRLHFRAPVKLVKTDAGCNQEKGSLKIETENTGWTYAVKNNENTVIGSGVLNSTTTLSDLDLGNYIVSLTAQDGYVAEQTITIAGSDLLMSAISGQSNVQVSTPIQFDYSGNGATDFLWNFGDGTVVENANSVSHVYNLPGIYSVTLTASNSTCSAVSTFEVAVTDQATGISELIKNRLNVFPNPTSTLINIGNLTSVSGKPEMIEVYDASGKLVERKQLSNVIAGSLITLPVSELSNGLYKVVLITNSNRYTATFSVSH
jgi:autotransporter-associated beta strand protein